MLVRQYERKPIAARLSQRVVHADRHVQEVVALVDHDGGVSAVFRRQCGAASGGGPQPRQQQRPDQLGGMLTDLALGQPGDQDAAVEDVGEVDRGGRGAEQIAGEPAGQHRPQPRQHRPGELVALPPDRAL
jgi:hypothetical protein